MRKKGIRRVLAMVTAAAVMCMNAAALAAGTMLNYNGSMYSLVLKSETDFSDGKYTGSTNGIGTLEIGEIDEKHGQSAILGAALEADASREGTWAQVTGDTTLPVSVHEFELYVDKMETGKIKFCQRGVNAGGGILPFYRIEIENEKISNENGSADFVFGEWHTVRILYDCEGHMYTVYVDDMQNAALAGEFSAAAVGMMFTRICLYASGARVALDNAKVYSAVKLIDGYEVPQLSLNLPSGGITESAEALIEAQISTKADIEKVEFFVDDKLVYTDTEKPFVLNYLFPKGEHTVRAVATDIYGAAGECTETIISMADTKPKITWELADGREYDKSELEAVSISVTMSGAALAKGTVSADGNNVGMLREGNNSVNLSGLSIGKHTVTVYAENNLGESTEKSAEITVTRTFDDVIWSADFNDGNKSGYTNGSGQFIRLETLRDDFMDSCLVGANTEQDVSKEGAWIPIELKNIKTVAITEFDLYLNRITGNGMSTILNLSASYRPAIFKIDKNGITSGDDTVKRSLDAGRWYHIKLMMDSQNTSYTLWLDDEAIFTNIKIPKMDMSAPMNSLRMVSKLQGTEESYFAVDNITVRQLTQAPSIRRVTSANGSQNAVSAKDSEITVYFSGALQPTSVYASKFTVDGAAVTGAVYNQADFSVTLKLDKPLLAGAHRITVAENLVMGNGEIYGEKLYGNFEVKNTFTEVTASSKNGGSVTAEISNNSADTQTVYMITNVYSGNLLKSSTVKEFVLKPGENSVSGAAQDYEDGNQLEVFFWDSLKIPSCIGSVED